MGCSNSYVEDGEFVFSEDEFQEVYEETNDKIMPINVAYYPEQISMEIGEKEDAIEFLDAISVLLDSDEARRLSEGIQDNENNMPNSADGDSFSITVSNEYSWYDIWVRPYTEE